MIKKLFCLDKRSVIIIIIINYMFLKQLSHLLIHCNSTLHANPSVLKVLQLNILLSLIKQWNSFKVDYNVDLILWRKKVEKYLSKSLLKDPTSLR